MDTPTFAKLLVSAPESKLSLVELVKELTQADGTIDMTAAAARQNDVEAARVQAEQYAHSTRRLRDGLRWKLKLLRN